MNAPLVFLHGWTMEGAIFDDVVRRLEDRFDCYAPDLPGHGAALGDYPPDIDGAAAFLAAYLERETLKSPILVGWSLGAMVAWQLARRLPDLDLGGLAIVDMSPKTVNDESWQLGIRGFDAARNEKALALMQADWHAYAPRINVGMYAEGSEAPHPETLAIIRRQSPGAMAAMWGSLCEADAREVLAMLRCPTLVINGARSRIYPAETAAYIARASKQSRIAVMEASGHSPHLEEPARFAEILADWATGLAAPR